MNPRVDAALDRLAATIDQRQRVQAHRELIEVQLGDVALIPLYWVVVPLLIGKGVRGPIISRGSAITGTIFEWERDQGAATRASASREEEMSLVGVLEPGEYREVTVFSDAEPVYRQPGPGGNHRPGDKLRRRRDFSVHDMEAGVTYHASFSVSTPGLGSPRHHHSFEQIRFVMSGEHEYAGKKYGGGWLGYFPEGVFYGPQQQLTESAGMVMQFPGPSGAPFHSRLDTERGRVLVREAGGDFVDGICVWPDGRKQDAHEALMEAIYGKDATYPAPAFAEQIWMNTNNIAWLPSDLPGVSVKRLGYFHRRGPAIQMIKLDPGASIPAGQTGAFMIRYIFEGEAEYKGQLLPAVSNLYYPPSAPYEGMKTATGATILSVELQATIPGTTQELSDPPLPFRV